MVVFTDKLTTTSMSNNDFKVVLNKTMQNGGNCTISLECDEGVDPNNMVILHLVMHMTHSYLGMTSRQHKYQQKYIFFG